MTVSTSLLQKEIYSYNPMMKGMANYFPCIGTHCLYEGQANGRKRKRGAGGRDKSVCLCVRIRAYHSGGKDKSVWEYTNALTIQQATTTCHSTNYLTQSL